MILGILFLALLLLWGCCVVFCDYEGGDSEW